MSKGLAAPLEKEHVFKYFCDAIESRAGIHLKTSKLDLIKGRLRPRLTATGHRDFEEYRAFLETLPADHPEWQIFVNQLTTNKTDFFRESKHFDFLTKDILPVWLKGNESVFKVWSAASSTGEEAYTLAMVLQRYLPKDRDFKILATDIDTNVIKTAQNAVYPRTRKNEIPPDYQQVSLDFGKDAVAGWFRIKPEIKNKVIFKQHNLIERSSPDEGTFNLVLCRNVLIYFHSESIEFVSRKLFRSAKAGGHLFIGHSESLQGIKHEWKSVAPSIFKKGSS